MIDALMASPSAHALGLALVQFVWQGTLLGLAGAVALLALRRASAHIRYLTAGLTLALMFGTLVITFAGYARAFAVVPSRDVAASVSMALPPIAAMSAVSTMGATASPPTSGSWIDAWWPQIVALWIAGVLFCALRFLRAWITVRRVRRSARPAAAGWPGRINALRQALKVTRRLRILESASVDVPSVIGWLRPLILVPVSALAGLSPSQFDAVLAHELAHVRRHDYLANILQSVVEILLFYHPAVWWVSRQIRREREHCCDDLAVAVCGDRAAYAGAIASLEELRAGRPALAMGARGGDLLARVRRLVADRSSTDQRASGLIPLAVAIVTITILLGNQGRSAAKDRPREIAPTVETAPVVTSPEVRPDEPAPAPTPAPARVAQAQPAPPRDPIPAPLQVAPGSIVGAVIDPQGGRLPGATVSAKSDAGTVHTAITGGDGRYQITGLVPGRYEVTVGFLSGWTTVVHIIQVGPSATSLSVRLAIGTVSESITVRRPNPSDPSSGAVPQADPRGPNDFLELAKYYSQGGRFAEAASMTSRALELLQAQSAAKPVEVSLDPNGPVRVGGDIRPPRKVRDVRPVYSAEADAAGVRGIVIIEAVIGRDGTVTNAKVVRSVPLLDQSALDAVRQWLFTPTLLNGVPVEVIMTVTVNFSEP